MGMLHACRESCYQQFAGYIDRRVAAYPGGEGVKESDAFLKQAPRATVPILANSGIGCDNPK